MDRTKVIELFLLSIIVVLFVVDFYQPISYNKPNPKNVTFISNETNDYRMKVFGTEYFPGEVATTFLQLLNENYEPVYNATCWLNVYYPNNSIFIYNAMMARFDEGLYYYDYVVPNISGIYMLTTRCFLPTLHHTFLANDFGEIYSVDQQGTYYNTHEVDNVYHVLRELHKYIDVYYNMTNSVDISNVTDAQIVMFYKLPHCTECLEMYIYDFVNNEWVLLPNKGSGVGVYSGADELVLSNPIDGGDLNRFVDENGNIMVRLRTSRYELDVDYIGVDVVVGAVQYTNLISLRGSGEVHVHSNVPVNVTVEEPPEVRVIT